MTPLETDLLEALKGVVRIVDALKIHNKLGSSQLERLDKAKSIIARAYRASVEKADESLLGERDQ